MRGSVSVMFAQRNIAAELLQLYFFDLLNNQLHHDARTTELGKRFDAEPLAAVKFSPLRKIDRARVTAA